MGHPEHEHCICTTLYPKAGASVHDDNLLAFMMLSSSKKACANCANEPHQYLSMRLILKDSVGFKVMLKRAFLPA